MLPRLEELMTINNIEKVKETTRIIRKASEDELVQIEELFDKKFGNGKDMKELKEQVLEKLNAELEALQKAQQGRDVSAGTNHESTANSNPAAERLKKLKENVRDRLSGIIEYMDGENSNSGEDIEQSSPNVTPKVSRRGTPKVTSNSIDGVLTVIHEVLLLMKLPLHIAKRLVDELYKVFENLRSILNNPAINDYLIIIDIESKNNINHCILEALRQGMSTENIV